MAWKWVGKTVKEDKYLDPTDVYSSRKALNQGLWECTSDLNSWDFPSGCVWGLNCTQSYMHGSRWALAPPGTSKPGRLMTLVLFRHTKLCECFIQNLPRASLFLCPGKCLSLRLNQITVLTLEKWDL